jgi:hypothetical protein
MSDYDDAITDLVEKATAMGVTKGLLAAAQLIENEEAYVFGYEEPRRKLVRAILNLGIKS